MKDKRLNLFEHLSDEESQLITGGYEDSMFIFIVDGENSYQRTVGKSDQKVFLRNFPAAKRLVSNGILELVETPQRL